MTMIKTMTTVVTAMIAAMTITKMMMIITKWITPVMSWCWKQHLTKQSLSKVPFCNCCGAFSRMTQASPADSHTESYNLKKSRSSNFQFFFFFFFGALRGLQGRSSSWKQQRTKQPFMMFHFVAVVKLEITSQAVKSALEKWTTGPAHTLSSVIG